MTAASTPNRLGTTPPAAQEDTELTAFLNRQVAAVLLESHEPRPCCPRCGHQHVNSAGFQRRTVSYRRLPLFECQMCGRHFSRTWGTPLAEKHLTKIDLFISLLSQPLALDVAGKRMGSLPDDLRERVKAYRTWLLKLDPSGRWERRVRLGGRWAEIHPEALKFAETGAREDIALSERLIREFDEIHSKSHQPVACPHCESRNTFFSDHQHNAMPRFRCTDCRARFTRRKGTPFVRTPLGKVEQIRRLIRYVSLPLPVTQVAEFVDTDSITAQHWRDRLAQWADQLEPDGSLSRRFRMGVAPTPQTPCPSCGRIGTAARQDDRGWSCTGCGRMFSMRRAVAEIDGVLVLVDEGEEESFPGTGIPDHRAASARANTP